MRELGIGNEFERPETVALLRRLSGLDDAERVLEWHAWRAGERIASLFAGLPHRGRLSGLVLSHDRDPALSAASPGEQLILALAQAIAARGLRQLRPRRRRSALQGRMLRDRRTAVRRRPSRLCARPYRSRGISPRAGRQTTHQTITAPVRAGASIEEEHGWLNFNQPLFQS